MYITNRFWTTVASLGALFFNCVNLAQDVEQKSWFHLAKLILILAVTYMMKSKSFEQTKRFSNKHRIVSISHTIFITGVLCCRSCWSLSSCCSWNLKKIKKIDIRTRGFYNIILGYFFFLSNLFCNRFHTYPIPN